jgi:hypothetical protein
MTAQPLDGECQSGQCVLSRSGRFCLVCGRSVGSSNLSADVLAEALAIAQAAGEPLDPDNPNYWVYLMHGAEIVDATEGRPNGGLAFYGAPSKRTSIARD